VDGDTIWKNKFAPNGKSPETKKPNGLEETKQLVTKIVYFTKNLKFRSVEK